MQRGNGEVWCEGRSEDSRSPEISTDTTSPYYRTMSDRTKERRRKQTIAMIPAMMTGTTHFIMRSGRRTAIAEIPTPDLAVPYLRRTSARRFVSSPYCDSREIGLG
jgi:hypothetical protein